MNDKPSRGFTLVELMIVVAIVGIIASIAYPSYERYVTRSKRSDGMAALMSLANAMERYKVNNYDYGISSVTDVFAGQVPVEGGDAYYILSAVPSGVGDTGYMLTATPTGSMSGKKTLTLTHTGARTWGGDNCWPEGGSTCP